MLIICTATEVWAESSAPQPEQASELTAAVSEEFIADMKDIQLVFSPTENERYQKKQQLEKDFARDLLPEQEAKKNFKKYKKSAQKNSNEKKGIILVIHNYNRYELYRTITTEK